MNPNNMTPGQRRQRASIIDGVTDEQLKAAVAQAIKLNPMMASVDPSMIR